MKSKPYYLLFSAILITSAFASKGIAQSLITTSSNTTPVYAIGMERSVNSCYGFLRAWYGKEAGLGLSEMGTDLFYYGYDNKQKSLNSYTITAASLGNNISDNHCLDQYWEGFYCAINLCNSTLKDIKLLTEMNATTRNQFLGEVSFLRAFYYFQMVNIWGPIPYYSEPFDAANTTPTRMPEELIYSNILSDIDVSIEAFNSANHKIKIGGHANYWAARAFKARTLLYAASWLGRYSISTNTNYSGKDLYALAQVEADAIINSGNFFFYNNYADTWSMHNEEIATNTEAIWGVSYSSAINSTINCVPYGCKTDDNGDPISGYNSLMTRTGYTRGGNDMLLMFVSRWNNGASDLGGNGREVFIRSSSEATSYVKHSVTGVNVFVADKYSPYGRGFTRYLPSLYLWQLLDKHKATDQRTNATLLEAYTIPAGLAGSSTKYTLMQDTAIYYCPLDGNSPEGIAQQAWAKGKYRIQFMSGGDIPVFTSSNAATALPTEVAVPISSVYNDNRYYNMNIGGWCSYPGIKKFLDNVYDPLYPTHDISKRDAMVFRLAEIYLIKAECQLMTENSQSAMQTVNQLRNARAISGRDNSLTGNATLKTILDERAIELCGEQQRWFDLKRTRTLLANVAANNAQASPNIQSYHLYRPIPQSQVDIVTNLVPYPGATGKFWQNEGY
jgi:starch-binding outer membrane protein, SusD/RagB family